MIDEFYTYMGEREKFEIFEIFFFNKQPDMALDRLF